MSPEAIHAPISRRGLLVGAAASAAAAVIAACVDERLSSSPVAAAPSTSAGSPDPPTAAPSAAPSAAASERPAPSTSPAPAAHRRVLYHDGALTDARSATLRIGVSILVDDGVIRWIRPSDDEGDPGPRTGLEVVDASGSTFVPGMVDGHSHVTLPGGAHWIERITDAPGSLTHIAEHNAGLLTRSGVRWARDVGSPRAADPVDGRERGLAIGVRDRWAASGRRAYPYVRAAGTWLSVANALPDGIALEARSADNLLALALGQLDDGADFIKLYLDGPDRDVSPWTTSEIRRVTEAVHARGATVTAHSTRIAGARAGVAGGVDCLEHAFELDAALSADMAGRGTSAVSTLCILPSFLSFAKTTNLSRFTSASGQAAQRDRLEQASASIKTAHAAGVRIATGTDFGGGSTRANHLFWEVALLVRAGLQPWEALAAATWRGGEVLGEPDAGVIAEGKPADFFLVHGDPCSDPAALSRVWRVAWID
ncbi:MAG: amidohydrolase family protein [Chloroflexi bacterium]|nr:amidohydrolase family protein [Chloroflexota bacterium]